MTEQAQRPEEYYKPPTPAESELLVGVASIVSRLVNTFAPLVIGGAAKRGEYRNLTFDSGYPDDGVAKTVCFHVDAESIEVRSTIDTYTQTNKYGNPVPITSNQYGFMIDRDAFLRFIDPEHAERNTRRPPYVSFSHSELRRDGYSTETEISIGGTESNTLVRTAPPKVFDPMEVWFDNGPGPSEVFLDDDPNHGGITLPDVVTTTGITDEEIMPFVDLLKVLGKNLTEVVPSGEYWSSSKSVVVE